jgi:hypothetical protein
MINLPAILPAAAKLPVLNVVYEKLDVVGNTLGRYLDYKKDTAMIEYETEKLASQTKVLVKKIDTELTKSLDENKKNFKKEMKRLKTIAKELKRGRIDRDKIIDAMHAANSIEIVREYRKMLSDEHQYVLNTLSLMSSYDSNTKMIEGV